MRFRLLRRRLTISAPRMAVRSALPWPLRWVVIALVLGFCAAVALWAFEFGKEISGLDHGTREEMQRLREEVQSLRSERDKAQSIANLSESRIATEKATQDSLSTMVKQLEAANQSLKDDLGVFQTLMPLASATESLAIRGLRAEVQGGTRIKWQLLLVQAARRGDPFKGRLEISLSGTQNGKPWSLPMAEGAQDVQVRQYQRVQGMIALPSQVVVKTLTAHVLDGGVMRASQTVQL